MSALQAWWHLVGFLAVPSMLGAIAAGLGWAVWRASLRRSGVGFAALLGRLIGVAVATALLALVVLGRDGSVWGYAAMVLACGLTLWWPVRRA